MRRLALLLLVVTPALNAGCLQRECADGGGLTVDIRAPGAGAQSLEVTLRYEAQIFRRRFEVAAALADGHTDLEVRLDPPPSGAVEAQVDVVLTRAGAAPLAASGEVRLAPDACNLIQLALGPPSGDAGPGDAAPEDASSPDADAGPTAVCGDGKLAPREACDDANAVSSDGCASCAVEPGWICAGEPSQCRSWGLLEHEYRRPIDVDLPGQAPGGTWAGFTVRTEGTSAASLFAPVDTVRTCETAVVARLEQGVFVRVPHEIVGCASATPSIRFKLLDGADVPAGYYLFYGGSRGATRPAGPDEIYAWLDEASIDRSGQYRQGRVLDLTPFGRGTTLAPVLVWDMGQSAYRAPLPPDGVLGLAPPIAVERDVYLEAQLRYTDCAPSDLMMGLFARAVLTGPPDDERATQIHYAQRSTTPECGVPGEVSLDGDLLGPSAVEAPRDDVLPLTMDLAYWMALRIVGAPARVQIWEGTGAAPRGWPDQTPALDLTLSDGAAAEPGLAGLLFAAGDFGFDHLLVRRAAELEPILSMGPFEQRP